MRYSRSPVGTERGMSLLEFLVALMLLSVVLLAILPVMDRAVLSDRGAHNTTGGSFAALQIMEMLKLYRDIQLEGTAIPPEFGGFAPDTPDPYQVDDTGVWATLGIDPSLFDMSYTLTNDATSGKLTARVSVTSRESLAGAGGSKWVEFTSTIE